MCTGCREDQDRVCSTCPVPVGKVLAVKRITAEVVCSTVGTCNNTHVWGVGSCSSAVWCGMSGHRCVCLQVEWKLLLIEIIHDKIRSVQVVKLLWWWWHVCSRQGHRTKCYREWWQAVGMRYTITQGLR